MHAENLATEAVAFILDRSPAMREALRRLAGRTGIEIPPLASFRSQTGDGQGNILEDLLEQLKRLHAALQSAAAVTIATPK